MFHNEDTVEVVATERRGRIDLTSTSPVYWRVQFSDGQQPSSEIFRNQSELRLVNCPHVESGTPGFYPETPIM